MCAFVTTVAISRRVRFSPCHAVPPVSRAHCRHVRISPRSRKYMRRIGYIRTSAYLNLRKVSTVKKL